MEFKVAYSGEGQECSILKVEDIHLVSVPGERPPTLQEVVTKVKTDGGFWYIDQFIPYHNIRSITGIK